jgi:uncharacterized protein (TIGR02594 family)
MSYSIYRIQAGDTLTKIAGIYGISLAELLALNPQIENPDHIIVGQPVNVPLIEEKAEEEISDDSAEALPGWYAIAKKEMATGIQEIPGSFHNPRIIDYHQSTTLQATDDETAWCSSFVNWCVEASGREGTKSAAARSWLRWGDALEEPREGCVAVIKRGTQAWQGHVGFFAGESGNHILLLGGNQGNEVSISSYPKERLLGYRWAAGV